MILKMFPTIWKNHRGNFKNRRVKIFRYIKTGKKTSVTKHVSLIVAGDLPAIVSCCGNIKNITDCVAKGSDLEISKYLSLSSTSFVVLKQTNDLVFSLIYIMRESIPTRRPLSDTMRGLWHWKYLTDACNAPMLIFPTV